jgi:dipeptidyl aminopeptidase/acylaminoacyl peptidase
VQAAAKGEPEWNSALRSVTLMTDPTPELRGITKQLVKYKRADGVDLSFPLYRRRSAGVTGSAIKAPA